MTEAKPFPDPEKLLEAAQFLEECRAHSEIFLNKTHPHYKALAKLRAEANRLIVAFQQSSRKSRADKAQEAVAKSRKRLRKSVLEDQQKIAQTGRRQQLTDKPEDYEEQSLQRSHKCYCCLEKYRKLHWFYDQLCPECAALNEQKRHQSGDLTGQYALVTGGRVKIGFQTALKLLRAGAHVHITTRFPVDASERYSQEPDSNDWRSRLTIHGLDLRQLPAVEAFAQHLRQSLPQLNILIHNAAQTIRRPAPYYKHLIRLEQQGPKAEHAPMISAFNAHQLSPAQSALAMSAEPLSLVQRDTVNSAMLSQFALLPEDQEDSEELFPAECRDEDGQQLDLREDHSWLYQLEQVSTVELIEVHCINCLAPALLNRELKRLMAQPTEDSAARFVIHVSSREGRFSVNHKLGRHPHTNMTKAALNMLTLSIAEPWSQQGIYVNSVDTGWVSNLQPLARAATITERHNFNPPLDAIDAAARILDPIFLGLSSESPAYGQFFRNYQVGAW